MPEIAIKGSDRKARVDARFVAMLPASIWVTTNGYRQPTPVCRFNGKCMSLARCVGLLSGFSDCQYILPVNGDSFDCRLRNVRAMASVPAKHRAANKGHKTGVKGIRPQANGRFLVVVREKYVGVAPTLEAAVKMLKTHNATL